MNRDRTARGGALLIALSVQALTVLIFGLGMSRVPDPVEVAAAMVASLLPVQRRVPDRPASTPKAHVHLEDPGIPLPVVPVDLVLDAMALQEPPPDPSKVMRTTHQESMGETVGTEADIGVVSRVLPDYPQAAVDRGIQGTTAVAILVAANGHPGAVKVLRSSGDAQLDAAAVSAVEKWQFTAAVENSHVVPRWGQLEVNFSLSVLEQQPPALASGREHDGHDPVSRLTAVFKSWNASPGLGRRALGAERSLELLSPALRRQLQKFGPVRSFRYLGAASRPPDGVAMNDAQTLRVLNASGVAVWDVFEVTQLRGRSQWYCAVDAAGEIRDILINDDANFTPGEPTRPLR